MRNIKKLKPEHIECFNSDRNIFLSTSGDFEMIVRQPRRGDIKRHRSAWSDLSGYTKGRYKRANVLAGYYSSRRLCKLPFYQGEIPGSIHLIMEIDDEIVGLADMIFKHGSSFQLHQIGDTEVGCSMNLCVLDKYQGLGIGSYYGHMSTFIAKHFGADWALGNTSPNKGMVGIRQRGGWETLGQLPDGNHVIRKRL